METKISKKEATRERILDAAARAVRRSGHTGASVAEVMKQAGLTHGGFYAHFGSRDEMVAHAIGYASQQSGERLKHSMAALQKKGATPFRALIESYLSVWHMNAAETGCVVAALGSEMPRQPEQIRPVCGESVQRLIRRVQAALPADVPATEAAHIASAMVGAIQLARALGPTEGRALLIANRDSLLNRYDRPLQPQ